MKRDEPLVKFDRPDEDDIEIIRNPAGVITYARKKDHSVLGYLLRISVADYGHEASATTYLDWKAAYLATRGFKIGKYDDRASSGGSDDEKASKYLMLIRRLGRDRQKLVETIIDQAGVGLSEAEMFSRKDTCLAAMDALGRKIQDVSKELGEHKKELARRAETR